MKIYNIRFILGILSFILLSNVRAATENPHLIAEQPSEMCLSCHIKMPNIEPQLNSKNIPVNLKTLRHDGIKLCTTCHEEEAGHIVGVTLDFSVPADLPLADNDTVSCLTCHYTHGALTSDRPQASYSFMDKLLDSKRLHKSFLIRRNNVNGELCLVCHNSQSR